MDSLSQIVLGAACGEAVAGRKIGNRAMLWGAIGGTIPDLDVMAEVFTDRMTAMAFHRGFMHSMLFAVLAPWILAFLVQWFYGQGVYRLRGYKLIAMLIWIDVYKRQLHADFRQAVGRMVGVFHPDVRVERMVPVVEGGTDCLLYTSRF